ncbi:hypothetical protein [Lonepinella sp. BR2357]|uniref:hypothetical protein n=1 Tax=Lonepinella sp. BR2357 TaxID=3434549 RepID=UPI003F6DC05D
MKKITLALAVFAAMGLSACANHNADDNSYKGTVLAAQYEGSNLKLVVAQDNCDANKSDSTAQQAAVTVQYNSDIVVGSCVRVSDNGVDNVSRSESRSWLSRTGLFL